jgi:hypothetical protein
MKKVLLVVIIQDGTDPAPLARSWLASQFNVEGILKLMASLVREAPGGCGEKSTHIVLNPPR